MQTVWCSKCPHPSQTHDLTLFDRPVNDLLVILLSPTYPDLHCSDWSHECVNSNGLRPLLHYAPRLIVYRIQNQGCWVANCYNEIRCLSRQQTVYSSAVIAGGWPGYTQTLLGHGCPPSTILGITELETLGYPTVKTASLCVPSFWHNTGAWRTDRYVVTYIPLPKL